MPLNQQQRALAIFGGVFGGGLLFTFLLVSLLSGGDDKEKKIAVGPNQPSTTSTTLPPTTIPPTLPPTTLPPPPGSVVTSPPATVTPGTVIVVPTTGPPATSPTTGPPATTPTTSAPTPGEQLETLLEAALNGGVDPPEGTPPRVEASFRRHVTIRATWSLDPTLPEDEQRYAAREEAAALLAAIQGFSERSDERVILRATLLDMDGQPHRVVRLVFEPATLDAIDFTTIDVYTIFELADDAEIDPVLEPAPTATTSTSSSTTTTT